MPRFLGADKKIIFCFSFQDSENGTPLSRNTICKNRAKKNGSKTTIFADFNGTIDKHNEYSQNYETKT